MEDRGMDAYSEDLRQRVVQACDDGVLTREEIADQFQVSTAWIRRLLQRRRETGSFSALPGGHGPKPKLTEVHLYSFVSACRKAPGRDPVGIEKAWPVSLFHCHDSPCTEIFGVESQKKSLRASEQDRADVRQARKSWPYRLGRRNKRRIFYLDESGAQTNLTRRYGRSPRGQRLVDAAPAGHWSSLTVVCAILYDGVVAPMVTDGPMNRLVFQGYVDWLLVPHLQPGDTVVMDNLSSHKSATVVQSIKATGAKLLYLPPYSPDLNPIEKMWSKVKTHLRAEAKRTKRTLTTAIGRALRTITRNDCRGFFKSVGIHAT